MSRVLRFKVAIALISLLVLAMAVAAALSDSSARPSPLAPEGAAPVASSTSSVSVAQPLPTLYVEQALTQAAQEQGLSGRASMAENHGMWFVFKPARYVDMWMKDMRFPLDMIWVGSDMRIIHIERDATPDSYPEVFSADLPAAYVLEVNSGYADAHDLWTGERITDRISLDVVK